MTLRTENLSLPGRIDGVSLELRPGDVTAIVGPNGAGKSSLLACMAGLIPPDSGTVHLGMHDLTRFTPRERARAIGYLPQTPEIAWDVSVETLVSLSRLPWRAAPLHAARSSASQDADAVEAAMVAMDVVALRSRPVSRLSGGERARVLTARVLAGEPEWILADEPLANLDLSHAATLMRLFRAEAKKGRGVALVLHDLATAINKADRVVVLSNGRIVADGTPEDALAPDLISRVWDVSARWLGKPGNRALSID